MTSFDDYTLAPPEPVFDPGYVYRASDGALTTAFYRELSKRGPIGEIAINLFRAQKTSFRAKKYRGGNAHGSYRAQSYDTKQWAMRNLCQILTEHSTAHGIAWGWKRDHTQTMNPWVLYVDLPEIGQVSFHSPERHGGPDYPADWDQQRVSAERIIRWCDIVLRMPCTS